MRLSLITPEHVIIERDVVAVTLPGREGQMTVMGGHDLLVTELSPGRLSLQTLDAEGRAVREHFRVGEGLAEITQRGATIFVESVQRDAQGGITATPSAGMTS